MKSIASINFRGGVGKSTVIWLIAKYIAEKLNKRTLVIDIDAQMNLTLAVQLDDETGLLNKEFGQWYNQHINSKKNLLNLLELYEKSSGLFDFSINSSFIYKMSDNLHFIPSTAGLYWLEIDAVDRDKIKDFVKTFLDKLEHTSRYNYDIVFF
ncbi:MAG: chromosome partitioning protein, partial [Bacteroidota bacterium]|nr:chromosome partitioning protein [Bacteroidota bacterium]